MDTTKDFLLEQDETIKNALANFKKAFRNKKASIAGDQKEIIRLTKKITLFVDSLALDLDSVRQRTTLLTSMAEVSAYVGECHTSNLVAYGKLKALFKNLKAYIKNCPRVTRDRTYKTGVAREALAEDVLDPLLGMLGRYDDLFECIKQARLNVKTLSDLVNLAHHTNMMEMTLNSRKKMGYSDLAGGPSGEDYGSLG